MSYSYQLIRERRSGEAIGIARIPEGSSVVAIYHRSGDSYVYETRITEAEYSTHESLELFPIYSWVLRTSNLGYFPDVVLYDPKYYKAIKVDDRPDDVLEIVHR